MSDFTLPLFASMPSFGPSFLERLAGKHLLNDPLPAVAELLANSWDAAADHVEILWPTEVDSTFRISDNGKGMTAQEFTSRWYALAYDRRQYQPSTVEVSGGFRTVYGKNGVGRFAAFCLGNEYSVTTTKDGVTTSAVVRKSDASDLPYLIDDITSQPSDLSNGTSITVLSARDRGQDVRSLVEYLSMRFLTDATFSVRVNGQEVSLGQIPPDYTDESIISLPDSDLNIPVITIKLDESDKTTRFHGFAFRVGNRFVAEPSWELPGIDEQIDGRRALAKRLLMIVDISDLADSVSADWMSIDGHDPRVQKLSSALSIYAKKQIEHRTEQDVQETIKTVRSVTNFQTMRLTRVGKAKWDTFVEAIARNCPSIRDTDIVKVASILANLEQSQSKFALLGDLEKVGPNDLDSLHQVLTSWSIQDAKTVLDELESRLKLLQELHDRTPDITADEVRELQPLFQRSLWILGPEFESIEYTSNRSMNRIIRDFIQTDDVRGSSNRPDFFIVPNGVGACYSLASYSHDDGDSFNEVGIDRLIILELKRAGVCIDDPEMNQCWKYVKELEQKGQLGSATSIRCFVLGSEIRPEEREGRKYLADRCRILPLTYDIMIKRAESRLFNLYDKLKTSPFLETDVASYHPATLYDELGGRDYPA